MANVRIDANGVPKAPVWEQTASVVHREAVTAVDGSDPDVADGVACEGFAAVDFDLDVTLGGTVPLLEVAPLFYDAAADAWFRGDSAFYTATGRYRLRAEARGALTFLAVVGLTGTSPTLALDVWASLS